jgi:hypothetical protein
MSMSTPRSVTYKCINLQSRFVSKRRFFVSVHSKTNRKIIFSSAKKTGTEHKQIEFRLVLVRSETKNPVGVHVHVHVRAHVHYIK